MKSLFCLLAAAFLLGGCAPSSPPAASSVSAPAAPSSPHVISPKSEALWQEALAAYGKWDKEKALRLCDEALAADKDNYKALSTKGIVTAFSGRPDEGAALVKQALSMAPSYTAGYYDLAMALKLGKHYDEAAAAFRKVLEKDPKNTWSWYGIATIYADRHDKKNALINLKKAIAIDPASVKDAARTQDHFQWLHGDRDFEEMVK